MNQTALIIDEFTREGFDGCETKDGGFYLVRHADGAASQCFDTLEQAEAALANYAADFSYDRSHAYVSGQRAAMLGAPYAGYLYQHWRAYAAGYENGRFWKQ